MKRCRIDACLKTVSDDKRRSSFQLFWINLTFGYSTFLKVLLFWDFLTKVWQNHRFNISFFCDICWSAFALSIWFSSCVFDLFSTIFTFD